MHRIQLVAVEIQVQPALSALLPALRAQHSTVDTKPLVGGREAHPQNSQSLLALENVLLVEDVDVLRADLASRLELLDGDW
jgi:hypothetical protein